VTVVLSKYGRPSPPQPVDMWTAEADATALPMVKEAHAQPRPSTIGIAYVQDEKQAQAKEQQHLWSAEGEHTARHHEARAKGMLVATSAVEVVLAETEKAVKAAHADHQHAAKVLSPLVRREPGAKWRYWICWPLLVLADTAGVWSAAVVLGDIPAIAFWQALGSGLAAGCAGLVGSELKDMRLAAARQRDPESLSEDERRYERLFSGSDRGTRVVKLVGTLSLLVVGLIAIGIFALRSSIESGLSGLTFGLLAAATAVASGLLGYAAADEVADLLATAEKRVRRAENRYLRLASSQGPKLLAESEEMARSIRAEYEQRGQAAQRRVESLSWRVLWRNAHIFGHGHPVDGQCAGIGWRCRLNGGDPS
jgi:hypothetical protein